MSHIKLFIATSLDGFIARADGSLDWLPGSGPDAPEMDPIPEGTAQDGGYGDFINDIDVVVMGRTTYEDILSFGIDWPYPNQKTAVVTSDVDYQVTTENTSTISKVDSSTIKELKSESHKDIWIVGGGKLITSFLSIDAIDQMTISVFSVILGEGIKLYPAIKNDVRLKLIKTEQFGTGFVNLTYERK